MVSWLDSIEHNMRWQHFSQIKGKHSTKVSILASGPSCPSVPKLFSEEKIVESAEVNQLVESEQWLKNVDWTDLVLASVQLALQKR